MPKSWGHALATFPGALVALVPSAACPLCLGAYAGIVSTLGIGVVFEAKVLLPLIAAFLLLGVAGAAISRRRHHRSGPLLVIVAGSLLVVAGRFVWNVSDFVYAGVVLLVFASAWNLWLGKAPAPRPLVQITTR